jgi:DNA-binding transcriptional ArsR family regulator
MPSQQHVDTIEARKLAGLLADEKRLRVSAALALGASNLDGICKTTGLEERMARRALGQLIDGGLVEDDVASGLRLRAELFGLAARHVTSRGKPDSIASLVRNGRLPRSREPRLAALGKLAALFEPGQRYPEAEVNATLSKVNPDYALLRRSLVDEGLLQRANELAPGGHTVVVYWRPGDTAITPDD